MFNTARPTLGQFGSQQRGGEKQGRSLPNRSGSHSRRAPSLSVTRDASLHREVEIASTTPVNSSWTKNEKYCITRLPGNPRKLQEAKFSGAAICGVTSGDSSHALLVVKNEAYIWSYITQYPEPIVTALPLPETRWSTALPLGSLVSPNAGSPEPGITIVIPGSGQIGYWDNAGSAVAKALIDTSLLSGELQLMDGETCTHLCNAEPAGFLVSTSKGRLVQVRVRDDEGRPKISVKFVTSNGMRWFGFFSTFARHDICAITSGTLTADLGREVYVATRKGGLERWDIGRNGEHKLLYQVDLSQHINNLVFQEAKGNISWALLDIIHVSISEIASLLILLSYPASVREIKYVLLLATIGPNSTSPISSSHVLQSYSSASSSTSASTSHFPKIYLPQPGKTAFIVFPTSIVLVALPQRESDFWPYEDVIQFKPSFNITIVAAGSEDLSIDSISHKKLRNPGVIIVTKGGGVMRCEAFDGNLGDKVLVSEGNEWVKSKLEQAIFYGSLSDNPIDFTPLADKWDVAPAALTISREILSFKSKYNPIQGKTQDHLNSRCHSLLRLAEYVQTFFRIAYESRVRLANDAEKCESARSLWNIWGRKEALYADGILVQVVKEMNKEGLEGSGNGEVRDWFRYGLLKIGELVYRVLKTYLDYTKREDDGDSLLKIRTAREVNEILLTCISTSIEARKKYSDLYSLNDAGDMGALPDELGPWTSMPGILDVLPEQFEVSMRIVQQYGVSFNDQRYSHIELEDVQRICGVIKEQLPQLVAIMCQAYVERIEWCRTKSRNQALRTQADKAEHTYLRRRGNWIRPLVEIDAIDAAYDIAETYQDFKTLVEISHMGYAGSEAKTERLEYYIERFNEPFAEMLYKYYINHDMLPTLLKKFPRKRAMLAKFLASSSKYAKLKWIHDLEMERYGDAGMTLLSAASKESDLLKKRFELSIGKLALLVDAPDGANDSKVVRLDHTLTCLNIQEKLREQLRVHHVDASDEQVAVNHVWESMYQSRNLKASHQRSSIVRHSLEQLIQGKVIDPESLIDLLTLKDFNKERQRSSYDEFFDALLILLDAEATMSTSRYEIAYRSIWRRAYMYDKWDDIVKQHLDENQLHDIWRKTLVYQTLFNLFSLQPNIANRLREPPIISQTFFEDTPEAEKAFKERFNLSSITDGELKMLAIELKAESKIVEKWAIGEQEIDLLAALQELAKNDMNERGEGEGIAQDIVMVDVTGHEDGDIYA